MSLEELVVQVSSAGVSNLMGSERERDRPGGTAVREGGQQHYLFR